MAYRVEVHRAAQKQILAFPKESQVEIVLAVDLLEEDPRPSGCKKLRGTDLWRVRAGRYRIIYFLDDREQAVIVAKVAMRQEDTYKGI